jgi:hypothetical protein
MRKYNIENPCQIKSHQQENLNKYYRKLGFENEPDTSDPKFFTGEINVIIQTIKNLVEKN